MRGFHLAAACALGALAAACASTPSAELAQLHAANASAAEAAVEGYKTFNDHCDRTYGWPFTATITCRSTASMQAAAPPPAPSTVTLSAEGLAALADTVKAAVKSAVDEALNGK